MTITLLVHNSLITCEGQSYYNTGVGKSYYWYSTISLLIQDNLTTRVSEGQSHASVRFSRYRCRTISLIVQAITVDFLSLNR